VRVRIGRRLRCATRIRVCVRIRVRVRFRGARVSVCVTRTGRCFCRRRNRSCVLGPHTALRKRRTRAVYISPPLLPLLLPLVLCLIERVNSGGKDSESRPNNIAWQRACVCVCGVLWCCVWCVRENCFLRYRRGIQEFYLEDQFANLPGRKKKAKNRNLGTCFPDFYF